MLVFQKSIEDGHLVRQGAMRTSGTWVFATTLSSFLPWYVLRWLEKTESTAREGCTLTITSLAWYAILATVGMIDC